MGTNGWPGKRVFFLNNRVEIVVFAVAVILMSNLSAIVDNFLHPEIPYFDDEHLLVGGVTGLVGAIMFGAIMVYAHHLQKAIEQLKVLEKFLPICANCKKIRISEANGSHQETWQAIESYVTEHTDTQFSHGICPDCLQNLYPDFAGNAKPGDHKSS